MFVPRRARAALFHDKTKRPLLHTRDIAHDYFHAVKVYAGKNNRHFTMPPVAPVLHGPRSIRFVSGAEENGRFQIVIVEIDRSAVEGDFEAMLIGRIGIAMRDLHSDAAGGLRRSRDRGGRAMSNGGGRKNDEHGN
ncbi:MAG TPA: hypothetical protein VI231_05845 [Candidatus Binatia bacterium]